MATRRKKAKPIEKVLSEAEMLKIELFTKDIRLKEIETLAMTQKKKILDLEFEKEQMKKHNEYRSYVEKKSNFLKELAEKYELESGLNGFDPITGEIKDE